MTTSSSTPSVYGSGDRSLAMLRLEAAGLQQRASQLTAATAQVERRLAELISRRAVAGARGSHASRIAELRELGRESVRLLEAAVRRREVLRQRIEVLERTQAAAPAPRSTPPQARSVDAPEPSVIPRQTTGRPALPPAPVIEPPSSPAGRPAPTSLAAPALTSGPSAVTQAAPSGGHAPIRRQQLDRLRLQRWRLPPLLAVRYAARALLGVLLVVLAFLLTPLPELFGWQVYAVQSGSMEHAIPLGSLIAVQPVRAGDLEVGDVITFSERTRPDVRVTHRIVSLETKDGQRLAVTKGDANNTTDSWNVPLSEAIGRVAFHVPYMGYVLDVLGSTIVKLAALALAGLMLALPSLRRRLGWGAAVPARADADSPRSLPVSRVAQAAGTPLLVSHLRSPLVPTAPEVPAELQPPDTMDDEEPLDEPDVSFDALAREIDALLGRIANDEAPTGSGARTGGARR